MIGKLTGTAKREIDATGRYVSPDWSIMSMKPGDT